VALLPARGAALPSLHRAGERRLSALGWGRKSTGEKASRTITHHSYDIHTLLEPHPHSGATYRLLPQMGNSYGVEVTIPGMSPVTVTGFASQDAAERWIAKHKEKVAAGKPVRPECCPQNRLDRQLLFAAPRAHCRPRVAPPLTTPMTGRRDPRLGHPRALQPRLGLADLAMDRVSGAVDKQHEVSGLDRLVVEVR
jgi:hypothetical protein